MFARSLAADAERALAAGQDRQGDERPGTARVVSRRVEAWGPPRKAARRAPAAGGFGAPLRAPSPGAESEGRCDDAALHETKRQSGDQGKRARGRAARYLGAMLALLAACSTPPAAPPAFAPDLSALVGAERACVEKNCADAANAVAYDACRADRCVATPAVWAVTPTLLRYDAGTVTMSVSVEHTPGAFGDVAAPAEGETYLGATVLTGAGEEIDMAVHTVFPDRLTEPFTFVSEVGPDVSAVIVGLWGRKIEPCDSTRSGCKMFGFVLDGSLAAYPEETYVANPPRRQRFLPPTLTLTQRYPAARGDAAAALRAALDLEAQRFGTVFDGLDRVQVVPPGETSGASVATGVVFHKHPSDGPVATRLARALGAGGAAPVACHDALATADLVIDLTVAAPAQAACR